MRTYFDIADAKSEPPLPFFDALKNHPEHISLDWASAARRAHTALTHITDSMLAGQTVRATYAIRNLETAMQVMREDLVRRLMLANEKANAPVAVDPFAALRERERELREKDRAYFSFNGPWKRDLFGHRVKP